MISRADTYELYKDDYAYHDGVEDVTHISLAGVETEDVKAKLELPEHSLSQTGSDIAVNETLATWVLWDSTLGGTTPREGETLRTSEGVVWRFISVSHELWDTQWHIQCRKDL